MGLDTSYTCVPSHNSFNSSTNGCKYTSIFFTYLLLGNIRTNIICSFFTSNHDGLLLLITTTRQIEQLVFWRKYGMAPSMVMLSHRLHTSSLNFSSHVSSICFMDIESVGICITPDSLMCEACHPGNIDNSFQRKILWILGITGMFLHILWGVPCDLPFFYLWYLQCPHFGHISLFTYSPLYRIKSF